MLKNFIKISLTAVFSLLLITLSPLSQTTFADEEDSIKFIPTTIPKPSFLPGPEFTGTIEDNQGLASRRQLTQYLLPRLAIGITGLAAGVAVLFLVIGGLRFATAYGDEEQIGKGKSQIIYSIVGLIAALFAFTIVNIIVNIRFEDPNQSQTSTTTNSSNPPNSNPPTTPSNDGLTNPN